MLKKLVCIGTAFIMLFSFAACEEFTEYKATAKAGLETYARDKGEENYSA